MTIRWTDPGCHYSEPPTRRIPEGEATGSAPRRVMTLADWLGSLDAATKTAGAIGAVLALYVLGVDFTHLIKHLGWLLWAAANGAS